MKQLTNFPHLVHFASDGTTAEFVMELKQDKDGRVAQYRYTKVDPRSNSLGKVFSMKLEQIERLIHDKLVTHE